MTAAKKVLLLLVAMLMLASVACGSEEPEASDTGEDTGDTAVEAVQPETHTVAVTDKEVTFEEQIESEPVTIEITNDSSAKQPFIAFGLMNGTTEEELVKMLQTKSDDELEFITVAGGLRGTEDRKTFLFPEGSYFVAAPDNQKTAPFFFTVGPASGPPVAEPETQASLDTGDFYFKPEGEFVAGEMSLLVTNSGQQHHMAIFAQGKKFAAEVLSPPPGGKLWTTVTLDKPGKYEMNCYFQDNDTNKPHFKLGMTGELEVTK
jgi:hypothetical protein